MKSLFRVVSISVVLLFAGLSHAMPFTAVDGLQIDNDILSWNEVADAGGYNIYYYNGGPSQYEIPYEYLSTVKYGTSYSGLQPGMYKVVAFDSSASSYGDLSAASPIWLMESGEVDDAEIANLQTTVSDIGSNGDRYIVETECRDDATNVCEASCRAEGRTGFVTGGACSASVAHINAYGDDEQYSCYSPEDASLISAIAYCMD